MASRLLALTDATTAATAVAIAAVLFGTSGSVAELFAPDLAPLSVACGRIIVGGTSLLVLACLLGQAPWRIDASPMGVLAGSLAVVGFQIGFFVAVDRLGVAQATVVTIATGPLVAALIDHVRSVAVLTVRWLCGAGMAIAGVALVCSGDWQSDLTGLTAAVLAGCALPIYGNVLRDLGTSGRHLGTVAAVFGGAVPFAVLLCTTPYAALPSVGELDAVIYLGLGPTALAYLLWARGLRSLTVRDTVLLTLLEPATAVVIAIAVLGQAPSAQLVVGVAIVLAGLAWASTDRRARAQRAMWTTSSELDEALRIG